MTDRKTVITHLQIIHTWAEFARERDLQFFTAKHLEGIAQWSDDALNLLKEQEHKDKMFHALEDDWKRLKELLKEQEEVVRCKDCKHGYECEFDIKCENEGNPQMFGTRHKPNWFCADGEGR